MLGRLGLWAPLPAAGRRVLSTWQGLDATQREMVEAARAFAQRELRGLADELERTNEPVPQAWLERYAKEGYLGINTPVEYGGLGLDNMTAVAVLLELCERAFAACAPALTAAAAPRSALRSPFRSLRVIWARSKSSSTLARRR